MAKINLIARVKTKDDAIETVKAAALGLVGPSRDEEGCDSYDVHQALDDPTVFIWYETWATQAALDEHFEKDYFKEFFALVSQNVAEPPVITLTEKIS